MTRSRARNVETFFEGRIPRTMQESGVNLVGATTTTIMMPGSYAYSSSTAPIGRATSRGSHYSVEDSMTGMMSPQSQAGDRDSEGFARPKRRQTSNNDITLTALLDGDDDTNIVETGGIRALVNVLESLGVHIDPAALHSSDVSKPVNIGSATPSPIPNISMYTLRCALEKLNVQIEASTLCALGFPDGMAHAICAAQPPNGDAAPAITSPQAARRSRRKSKQSHESEPESPHVYNSGNRRGAQRHRSTSPGDDYWQSNNNNFRQQQQHRHDEEEDLVYDPYTATFSSKHTMTPGNSWRRNWATARTDERPAVEVQHYGRPGTRLNASSNSSIESASSPALHQAALQLFLARVQANSEAIDSGSSSASQEPGAWRADSADQANLSHALSELASASTQLLGQQSGETQAAVLNHQLSPQELIDAVHSLKLAPEMTNALVGLIRQASNAQRPGADGKPADPAQQQPGNLYMLNESGDLVEYDMVPISYESLMAFDPAADKAPSVSAQLGLSNSLPPPMDMKSPVAHIATLTGQTPALSGVDSNLDPVIPSIVAPPPSTSFAPDFTSPTAYMGNIVPAASASISQAASLARPGGPGDLTPVLRAFMRQKFADDSATRVAFASPSAYLRARAIRAGTPLRSTRSAAGTTDENEQTNNPDMYFLSPKSVVKMPTSAKSTGQEGENTSGTTLWERRVPSASLSISVAQDEALPSTNRTANAPLEPGSTASVVSIGQLLDFPPEPEQTQTASVTNVASSSNIRLSSTGTPEAVGSSNREQQLLAKRPRLEHVEQPGNESNRAKRARYQEDMDCNFSIGIADNMSEGATPKERRGTPRGAVNARRSKPASDSPFLFPFAPMTRITSLPIGPQPPVDHSIGLGCDSSSSTQTDFEMPRAPKRGAAAAATFSHED
jgi:hypothetical protein